MFKKVMSLNRVRDTVVFREGDEEITMRIDSEVNGLMRRIQDAEKLIVAIHTDSTEEERKEAAMAFAVALFGDEQAKKLFEFYNDDEGCVITICGMYFSDRKNGLCRKITKVQKRLK